MKSYINVFKHGNNLIHSYIEDGIRKREAVKFRPMLGYITPNKSEWTDIHNNNLAIKEFDDMSSASDWKTENHRLFDVFGDIDYTIQFITQNYTGEIPPQKEGFNIYALDIEAIGTNGFPKAENDGDIINGITFLNMVTRKYYTYGLKDFIPPTDDIMYFKCRDEAHLLECTIQFFSRQDVDCITGWYLAFDVPYLCDRIEKILGKDESKRLSPVRKIYKKTKTVNKRQVEVYDIKGIIEIDYLSLYQKFTFDNKDSYTLDNICKLEIDESKLEYKTEYGSLNDLYEKDPQKFYEYNCKDCELILLLDDKLRFIDIAISYSHMMRCTMSTIFVTVTPWDALLYSELYALKKLCPPNKNEPAVDYGGGYVKEPKKGLIGYTSCSDVTSSYPNQEITFNMGPETLVPESYIKQHPELDIIRREFYGVESCLDINQLESITETLKKHNVCFTCNGQFFYNDRSSFIANIVDKIFQQRMDIKRLVKNVTTKHEKELLESKSQILKICINSNYGFLGCNYSRYYDIRIAEAITMQGQLCARGVAQYIEDHNDVKWIYQDTDSATFELQEVIDKRFGDTKPDQRTILDFVLKYQTKVLDPCIDNYFGKLGKALNVNKMTVKMEHEFISDKSIYVAKKMYIVHQIYKEGKDLLSSPKYKIKGLAVIKTAAYPAFTRNIMRKIIEVIVETEDNKLVIDVIKKFKPEFYKATADQISTPISVNMVGNRTDKTTGKVTQVPLDLKSKGLPKQVRAAFVFNKALKQLKLTKKYPEIKDGEKIRIIAIKQPNVFESPVIGCVEKFPPEILENIKIDYDEQWNKTFKTPVLAILEAIGYNFDRVIDLGGFFD